ncbi:MAG: tRNA (guanosine(37)-N1)-methyltransferase TrmD [Alphaproteobacteria bacterium]|nr:tRNA (guanosine(37)-N1)-methyltransferase TrmD [Alphaproteobacteria bacterium]
MKFQILTLFPELHPGPLASSITGRALERNLWELHAVNIRDYAGDRHKSVDDVPFGGGAGMVMKPDVLAAACGAFADLGRAIYLSPRGRPLTQSIVQELAGEKLLTLLCGRYEGVDQRVLDAYQFEEISIGDYVLTNGDLAAHILIDAAVRLLPDVLGNAETAGEESFSNGLLEYPHYTRPAEWVDDRGCTHHVPDILLSGHHAKINQWRHQKSLELTAARRPDLLNRR